MYPRTGRGLSVGQNVGQDSLSVNCRTGTSKAYELCSDPAATAPGRAGSARPPPGPPVRTTPPHPVSSLLDTGLDLATVQKLVGHASPDTTVRYDLRGEEVARRGAALHHIPYRHRAG